MNYPFSPRTWSSQEWQIWIEKLKNFQISDLFIWPLFEYLNPTLSKEELKWLDQLNNILAFSKKQSIRIHLGRSTNACLNPKYSHLPFSSRNQTHLAHVHPEKEDFEKVILNPLKNMASHLAPFHGWWTIDSDPGQSYGTGADTFSKIFYQFYDINTNVECLTYWMWSGWTDLRNQPQGWRDQEQPYWSDALNTLLEHQFSNKLQVMYCWPGHKKSQASHHLKTLFMNYNHLEAEPSIPWSANRHEAMTNHPWENYPSCPHVENLQTPCLRTPLLENKPFNSKTSTTWNHIETHWCWNEASLESTRKHWLELQTALESDSRDLSHAINKWKLYTGFPDHSRRGYLHQLLNRKS